MADVVIYSSEFCGFCQRAKQLLAMKNIDYTEIIVDGEPEKRQEMEERSGDHQVPQIFINGKVIGGCDALYELERTGQLDKLLAE